MAEGKLLKNVSIALTQNPSRKILRNCDIAIGADGKIEEIGDDLKPKGRERIDCKRKLALPGLVNTHCHLPMGLLRGAGDGLKLHDWLNKRIFPLEAKMKRADYCAGAELSLAEAMSTGTTCIFDFYKNSDYVRKSLEKSGLRVFSGHDTIGNESLESALSIAESAIKKNRPGKRVQAALAPHSIYACPEEAIRRAFELAEKRNALFQMHASETRKEVADCERERKIRPVEYLDSLGVLSKRTSLAHCGWISKREARTIAERGSSVSHCPVSNMKLATGGVAPVPELLSYGANVSLGTDGSVSNNSLDMFETMKLFSLIQKFHRWDASIAPASQALDFATINGAKLLGLEKEIGSIEEGKSADIALMSLDSFKMHPLTDPVSQVVYASTGSVVTDVFVCGETIVREGKTVTLDREKTISNAERLASALISRAGKT